MKAFKENTPNPGHHLEKSKIFKKVMSREEEKRRFLGHIYSQMFTGGCTREHIQREQEVWSAKYDAWKPPPVDQSTVPNEDESVVKVSEDSRPSDAPEVTSAVTVSESNASEPAYPTTVAFKSKEEQIVAEVSRLDDSRPSDAPEVTPLITVSESGALEPTDPAIVALQSKMESSVAEVSQLEKASPSETKPEQRIAEDSTPVDFRPTETPSAVTVASSKTPEPADQTTVPKEFKQTRATMTDAPQPEDSRPLEGSKPADAPESEDQSTMVEVTPLEYSRPSKDESKLFEAPEPPSPTSMAEDSPPKNPRPSKESKPSDTPEVTPPVTVSTPRTSEPVDQTTATVAEVTPSEDSRPPEDDSRPFKTSEPADPSTVIELSPTLNPRPPEVPRPSETPKSADQSTVTPRLNTEPSVAEVVCPSNPGPSETPEPANPSPAPAPKLTVPCIRARCSSISSSDSEAECSVTEDRTKAKLFKPNLTMQEEIAELTEEERQLYKATLQNLSSIRKIQLSTTPKDQKFQDRLEIVKNYTPEQSIRFQAMESVWTARKVPSEDKGTNLSPFVDTVTGHYGIYQVIENRRYGKWKARAWYSTGLQEVLVTSQSKFIGSDQSPISTIILGDVLLVKELIDGTVFKLQILKRRVRQTQTTRLLNGMYVIKGYGRAVECDQEPGDMKYVKSVNVYVPIQASEDTPDVQQIKDFKKERPEENAWRGVWVKSNASELTPEATEFFLILASSMYNSLQYGAFDQTFYTADKFQRNHGLILFRAHLGTETNKLWNEGIHISVAGGRWILEITRIAYKGKWFHNVTAKVLHGDSRVLCERIERKIRQVGVQLDRPILEKGFLQKLDEKSNGRRIIRAIFEGAEPIQNEICVADPHDRYIQSLLSHAPITIGSFPILSGKTTTIASAALELAQRDSKSMNLILTPDANGARIAEEKLFKMSNDVKIVRFGSVKLFGGEIPEKTQILILECKEFWRIFKNLQNVKSIQFDDMHLIPQIELIQIATVFPTAIFGIMGDRNAPPPESQLMTNYQNELVFGELLNNAEKYGFPVIKSQDIYNVPPEIVKILARIFQMGNRVWMDPMVPRKIEEYPIEVYRDGNERFLERVENVLQETTVSQEEIGIICSDWIQFDELKKFSDRILVGFDEDFKGIQKKVIILLWRGFVKSNEKKIRFLMTRATMKTHLVQCGQLFPSLWMDMLLMVQDERKAIKRSAERQQLLSDNADSSSDRI